MEEDYWHWRLQAAARRELMRLTQLLGRTASFQFGETLGSRSLQRVLSQLSNPPLSQSLNQSIQQLARLEQDALPLEGLQDQESLPPEDRLRQLAELTVELFALAVQALDRREELLRGLQGEVRQLQGHLDEARERETLEILQAPAPSPSPLPVQESYPALAGLFGQQLEWAQARIEQSAEQLRHQEQRLDEAQKQARSLEFALLDKQNELRFQEHKLSLQRRDLKGLKQRSGRLRQTTRELRQQNQQLLIERDLARARLQTLEGQLQNALPGQSREQERALRDAERELEAQSRQLEQQVQRTQDLQARLDLLESRLRSTQTERNQLAQRLEESTAELQRHRQQVEKARQLLGLSKSQNQQLQAQNENSEREREEACQQRDELAARCLALEALLEDQAELQNERQKLLEKLQQTFVLAKEWKARALALEAASKPQNA